MKKTGRIIIALITVLALGLTVAGCSYSTSSSKDASNTTADSSSNTSSKNDTANASNSSSATTNNESSDVVGTWKYESGMNNADYSYVFNADGTGKLINRLAGGEVDITYKTQDGKITIETPSSPVTSTPKEYRIEGNKLIVKDSEGKEIVHVKES